MEKTDLYKLPKVVLVHLISTIQHDLAIELKQTKRNAKRKFDAIREKCKWISIEECSFEGCHRFFLFEENIDNDESDIEYYNDGRITFCQCICDKYKCDRKADKGIGWWCQEHVPSNYFSTGEGDDFNFMCDKCKKEDHYTMHVGLGL